MANIQIIQGNFEKKLKLQFAPGIRAGFPSPAEDYNHETLDFNRDLIRNPDSIGFSFTSEAGGMFAAPINGGMRPQMQGDKRPMMQGGQPPMGMRQMRGGKRQVGEYITDLDMQKYLNYVVSTQALKGVPAFDSQIEGINRSAVRTLGSSKNASGENEEFGDGKTTIAPHWYIRHGARDRDTAFPVPVNFATKLQNVGKDVNFFLAWNRPHSGDYALDELFRWIADITKYFASSKPIKL